MQQAPRSYTLHGDMITVGTKRVTVRCPRHFKRLLDSRTQLLPIAEYFRRSKDEDDSQNFVTFFRLKVLDCAYIPKAGESPKTYEVQFELPEELSPCVQCEEILDTKVCRITPNSDAATEYMHDLNEALLCWFDAMKVKCDQLINEVEFRNLSSTSVGLKWNSKTTSVDEFISQMDPELNKYTVAIGVGYYSGKDNKIGISLNLSMFYALTSRGAYLKKVEQSMKASKKRKVVALTEKGEEGEVLQHAEDVEEVS